MQWRLILDEAANGAQNMAADEALLLTHTNEATRVSQGTLRFYSWNPACLSLGRFQNWNEISGDAPAFDMVRRPTGGRAVWHQHEITYCAVFSEECLPRSATSVAGAYAWLSRGFVAGLQSLGVAANLAQGDVGRVQTPNCFASATRADFVVDHRKLLGAAQCRQQGVVLQHGSLLLDIDESAWRNSVGATRDVTSLRTLGVEASRAEIIAALCAGCEGELNIALAPGDWSEAEQRSMHCLRTQKYECASWNRERKKLAGSAGDYVLLPNVAA